ncbi:MAG: penicillin acylase family protein [Thermoflexibacter sp.]|nr:penicillin acylase family protein [Thermoflexibacter sp.]
MPNKSIFVLLLIQIAFIAGLNAQSIDPNQITIARDKWGVPHIFAKTDEEVAYGLAWATAEDDFQSMQFNLLSGKSMLARAYGKKAAVLDVLNFIIASKEIVDTLYDKSFSPKFKRIISAYTKAVNVYAAKHPQEILVKQAFPITEKEVIQSYVLNLLLITGVQDYFSQVFNNQLPDIYKENPIGSNAFAISKNKTTDGKTYLAINSHQPLEGAYSWYEAHLHSEEGWNILGGLFPGGMCVFHGVNQNLGWAHTVNYGDFADVYQLEMHPTDKLMYKFDGKWEKLQERTIKLKVKIGLGLKIGVKRTFFWGKHGATIKNDKGFYAIRFASNMRINAVEQWYQMNKAQNFTDFKKALDMQAHAGLNMVYADKDDNIMYLSNGLFPQRNLKYNYLKVVEGNTSDNLWQANFLPVDSLAFLVNPQSGYVFNCNNTPFNATAPKENLKISQMNPSINYIKFDNNRSLSFQQLIKQYDKLTYADFKRIKYDLSYLRPMYFYNAINAEAIFSIDENKYPEIADIILKIRNWDRKGNKENTGASIWLLFRDFLGQKIAKEGRKEGSKITENDIVEGLKYAKKHLLKYFKTLDVPLGDIQKHVRGSRELPMSGLKDVLAAMSSKPYKNGQFRTDAGESYISLVQFSDKGVEVETVNAYGASNKKESPHYTDQMEMFVNQQLKPMTLDKEKVLKEAIRIYHPL